MLDPRRQLLVEEALTWRKTPFHHAARVKGAGVDCLTFIVEVYERVGIVAGVEIPFYRPDFMRHNREQTYLEGLLRYGKEVEYPLPGDILIVKWGRIFAHAAIVIDWPRVIHASTDYGVIEARGDTGKLNKKDNSRKFISAFKDQYELS
jgi:cell wall-associated NlpC family hydrolase